MKVKIKKLHPEAKIPKYAKPGDAGMDMFVIDDGETTWEKGCPLRVYKTGIAMEIPEGYVGLIFPRSSIRKYALTLSNSVGVIDSGYRGEISFTFRHVPQDITFPDDAKNCTYKKGDKVGQIIIMPYPQIEFEEVDELSKTERGSGGFGSTGA